MSIPAVPVTVATEPQSVAERAAASRSFVGHAKLIGGLTLVSRVLGLAREVVAGHYLGTGVVASAFTVAFTIPNLFRKLFGEGALSAAFIPLYAQAVKAEREREEAGVEGSEVRVPDSEVPGQGLEVGGQSSEVEGQNSGFGVRGSGEATQHPALGTQHSSDFAAAGVNLLVLILIAVTLVGELVLGGMIFFGRGLPPDRVLTLKFAAIMLPYVILICATAFLGGVLQVHKRFGPPAAAPIILNACHIAVVFIGARVLLLHREADPAVVAARQTTLAYWLSFVVLVAGVLQVVVLMPGLRAVGFRFRFVRRFWTPGIRRMLRLTVPVAVGVGVLQLSVLLDRGLSLLLTQYVDAAGHAVTHFTLLGQTFAYPMEAGAPARLNLAQFLYQFPLGVFAIALATAIFPSLSSEAKQLDPDLSGFKSILRQGMEATMLEGLPASLGLILVREPAIRLLFQHGAINAHDADLISRSVLFYSMAIWAFSLQQIINRAYYALHDTKTPLVMSIVTLAVNLAVEIPLLWTPLGEAGMAAGTCASFVLQAVVMLWILDRRLGGLGLGQTAKPVLKMLAATAVMGVSCWLLKHTPLYPGGPSRAAWLGQLLLLTVAGAAVYFATCRLLGLDVMRRFRPRGRRGTAAATSSA